MARNLFVYLGAGRGYPGPYGAVQHADDGRAGAEPYARRRPSQPALLRGVLRPPLAPPGAGAIVILNHVAYAAGSSEPGHALPTRTTAAARADNYAAGFLGAGAAVVFASDRSVTSIIRDLFGANRTMQEHLLAVAVDVDRVRLDFQLDPHARLDRHPRADTAPAGTTSRSSAAWQSTTTDWQSYVGSTRARDLDPGPPDGARR